MKFLPDIYYACRLLLKKPFFSIVTVFIMAVGLGLSIYTYSLLSTLLYKPLDLQDGKSLVAITGKFNRDYLFVQSIDAYVTQQIREQSKSFSQFSIHHRQGGTALISGRNSDFAAKKFNSSFTQWTLFEIAAVQPLMGRVLQANDHLQGAEPVIVIAYSVWQNYFSSDPNIVGRVILVDASPTRVVGVMPDNFSFPNHAQMWQPITQTTIKPQEHNQAGFVNIIARLKPGVSIEQANADVAVTIQRMKARYPNYADNINAFVKPFKYEGLEKQMPLLISMAVIVALILILACLNIGNLLLSRVNDRLKEIAIRVALGVPRYRLVLQMFWESLLISILGGGLALLLAAWGLELTNNLITKAYSVKGDQPFWWRLSIDSETVVATAVIIILTVLITSVAPVWRAVTSDFNAVLRDGTRGAVSRRSAYYSNVLVVSEILLSCVVLVVASLIMTMAIKASSADYGVDTNNILVGTMELPQVTYGSGSMQKRTQFYDRLQLEMEKEPNIKNLMSMSTIPGSGGGWQYIEIEGREYPTIESRHKAYSVAVLNGSIKAFEIPLLEGRYFDDRDTKDNNRTTIISRSLANELFPQQSAVGQRIGFFSTRDLNAAEKNWLKKNYWMTVVGVVEDVIYGSVIDSSNIAKTIYYSNHQSGIGTRFFVSVRYEGSEKLAKQAINNALKRVDPDVAIYNLNTYEGLLAEPLFLIKNMSKLFMVCGLMAVLLAASGIYAVVVNSVAMRRQEIGVRRALGAVDVQILNLFIRKSLWQLIIGVSTGLMISIGLTLIVTDFMAVHMVAYIVGFIGMPILIVSMVILATYFPTKRSIVLEPSVALHCE